MTSDARGPHDLNKPAPHTEPDQTTVEWSGAHAPDQPAKKISITANIDTEAVVGPGDAGGDGARTAGVAANQTKIGRYRLIRILGQGGFGTVYLAHDDLVDRPVAIKVPRADRLDSQRSVDRFLAEARHVSWLKHPSIVTLFDCGQADGNCYLVYEFIEGLSLGERIMQGPISHGESATLIAEIAEALHYAHGENIFHRDIKPGNILLDKHGRPHVTDFGLAVREEELAGERGRRSGTCPYISPEQVRGEGHRIDGRTDIYSLGATLYELLCNRPPFDRHSGDVLEQIIHRDPRPPRQIDDSIPRELERICLKALAKQLGDRYLTAKDMAEDLRAVASPIKFKRAEVEVPRTQEPERTPRVVPKGLRSFGPEDSEFFLELLPGPRNRDGLPESIRFWKNRIESRDPEVFFSVGLMYGPSGCGKSSLVKAGLLPRMDASVTPIYVEATREDTETRLTKGLRRACAGLSSTESLSAMIYGLRSSRAMPGGSKVLIVIDQFEQWLHVHSEDMEKTELIAALRQADGEHVQVILLVRDDFWLGVSRLFSHLEIHLNPERNTRLVDLFDLHHAQHVLLLLGQAYDRLPASSGMTAVQNSFLDQASQELSQDGRVIPVRLALFAELMKERPWSQESLVQVGGTEGVGVRFLEETFTARTAVPDHRTLEKPVRALLQALLPEGGTDIKGHMRSRAELAAACRLGENSPSFNRLIEILDRELHLITPTEQEVEGQESRVEGQKVGGEVSQASGPQPSTLDPRPSFYQLTHDYLVPPLRHWLTLARRKTWRGRAELVLEERAAQMSQWPESRYLPSLAEFLSIAIGVPRNRRKSDQQALITEATRHHSVRVGSVVALLVLAALVGLWYAASITEDRVDSQVDALLHQSPDRVETTIVQLEQTPKLAVRILRQRFMESDAGSPEQLHAAFALARLNGLEANHFECLLTSIGSLSASECKNLVAALQPHEVRVRERLLGRAIDTSRPSNDCAREAVVLLHLGEPEAARKLLQGAPDPAHRTQFIHNFASWHADLSNLPGLLRQIEDGDYRSGICTALGMMNIDSLGTLERDEVVDVLMEIYRDGPDGGSHTAAGFALVRWGLTPTSMHETVASNSNQTWYVTKHGLTMIEIPPGKFVMQNPTENTPGPSIEFTRPFYMSDREIPAQLVRAFFDDPNKQPDDDPNQLGLGAPPTLDDNAIKLPAQSVSWFEAILFCNWLSRREGLDLCYSRTDKKETLKTPNGSQAQFDVWQCKYEANGYRLPQEPEWEYASRAGATTDYFFGNQSELLENYAVCNVGKPLQSGAKAPNRWGAFDMVGNVMEWCWNPAAEDFRVQTTNPKVSTSTGLRSLRGGNFRNVPAQCYDGMRFRDSALNRSARGFRVVCSCRPPRSP